MKEEEEGRKERKRKKNLVHNESHRHHLIQQPQLSPRNPRIPRVHKNPSIQQGPMDVTNHTPNVSQRERSPTLRVQTSVNVFFGGFVKKLPVPLVDGVDFVELLHLGVLLGENKFSSGRVEGETVHPLDPLRGHHQNSGRTVHDISGSHNFL